MLLQREVLNNHDLERTICDIIRTNKVVFKLWEKTKNMKVNELREIIKKYNETEREKVSVELYKGKDEKILKSL